MSIPVPNEVINDILINDPAIPLLDIYPEETIIQKQACILMFAAPLFTQGQDMKAV